MDLGGCGVVDWWIWADLEWLWRLWSAGIIDIGRCRIDIGRCRIDIGRCRIATATYINATAIDINATATDINATKNAGMRRCEDDYNCHGRPHMES